MNPDASGPQIPTIGKAQPPVEFSYPIGSAVVSEAFRDLPQFPLFTLSFSSNSPLLNPDWHIPGFPVLRLGYSSYPEYVPRTQSIRPRRQGGIRWQIDVMIVPKEKRDALQPLITEQALPLLREWILGPDAPRQTERRRTMEAWWFEDTGVMKLHDPDGRGDKAEPAPTE
jgi:hypothetical protein